MSSGELLLLTYGEAIKSLKKAELALSSGRYELFEHSMEKAARIVRYLIRTLDMEQPISGELLRLYHYLLYAFGRVLAGRERLQGELSGLTEILQELQEGFAGAEKQVTDIRPPRENSRIV